MYRVLGLLGTMIVAGVLPASACSVQGCVGRGTELRSDFTLHVSHGSVGLKGVTVTIKPFEMEDPNHLMTLTTNESGDANVRGLAPGDYWLSTDYLGISAGSECFHVLEVPSSEAKTNLQYEWGDLAVSTQTLAGRFVDVQLGRTGSLIDRIKHKRSVAIVGAKLKLQGAVNQFVGVTISDSEGGFDFSGAPEGTYVLHVEGGNAEERAYQYSDDLLINFSSTGKLRSLLILQEQRSGGSCGGMSIQEDKTREDTKP